MENWIPFETVGGILLLQGSINGVNGTVILDTGSQHSVINAAYFMEQGKISASSEAATTVDENGKVTKTPKYEVTVEEIRVGDVAFRKIEGIALNLDYVENQLKTLNADIKVLGTIGMDIISRHTVCIDYRNGRIAFDMEIDNDSQGISISFMPTGLIVVPVSVNGADYPFIMDTGASVCVAEDVLKKELFASWIDEKTGLFASGDFSVFGRKYNNVTFLSQNLGDIKKGATAYGIIGSCCLLDAVVILDCPNSVIYMS